MAKCLRGLFFLVLIGTTVGCNDEECSLDGDCDRGEICLSSACEAVSCDTAADCPEGNRTCILGYGTCGQKECNSGMPELDQCPSALCDTGSFSCLTPCESETECIGVGVNSTCQNGLCRPRQRLAGRMDAMVIGSNPMDSAVVSTDMNVSDGGFVPQGVACAPCSGTSDCNELGANAVCEALGESAYCFGSCANGAPCPQGFSCREGIELCVPVNGSCEVCPGKPCAPGLVCNSSTGACVDAPNQCERCFGEGTCAEGLDCIMVDGRSVCLSACVEGICEASNSCENDHCVPTAGRCDPCNGACGGALPVCIEAEGICGECGPQGICGLGEVCNMDTWRCEAPSACDECVTDTDCGTCSGRNYCIAGDCVACLQQSDCPPRSECNTDTFECESSPCSGVACQGGATCSPASGICEKPDGSPGCTSPADCPTSDLPMGCNTQTGQCYYTDGTCDANPGGNGVCSPGSDCAVDPLSALGGMPKTLCFCNLFLPSLPIVECHPGINCNQLPPGILPEAFDGPGTCGASPF